MKMLRRKLETNASMITLWIFDRFELQLECRNPSYSLLPTICIPCTSIYIRITYCIDGLKFVGLKNFVGISSTGQIEDAVIRENQHSVTPFPTTPPPPPPSPPSDPVTQAAALAVFHHFREIVSHRFAILLVVSMPLTCFKYNWHFRYFCVYIQREAMLAIEFSNINRLYCIH